MKKYVMFGGFDYPIKFEMNQNAIFEGIDYFINETFSDGEESTYLGKPIYSMAYLKKQNPNDVFILIGSLVYYAELELKLKKMGFKKDVDYMWAFSFPGDEKCGKLWYTKEWRDEGNICNRKHTEEGTETIQKYEFVSQLLDESNKNILELGAANCHLKKFLSEDVNYIPVDYIKYSEDHIVCDLNQHEFPDVNVKKENLCILMLGMFQYITDWKWLLRKIADSCNTFICSHNDIVRVNREYRRTGLTWNNAIFNHDIIIEMGKLGFKLVEAYDFRFKIVIMKFVKEDRRNEV